MIDPYQDERTKERLRMAALTSIGVTGGLAAAQAIPQYARDKAHEKVKKTASWDKLLKQLQPGDIIFSRKNRKFSGKSDLGPIELPITEQDVMNAAKGDPFYHGEIYEGKGNVVESADWKAGVKSSRLWKMTPEELKVYRAKNPKHVEKALKYVQEMKGTPYKNEVGVLKHGIKYLAGIPEKTTGKKCKTTKGGIVCTELVAEAYPKLFKNKLAGPAELQAQKGMDLVARYGNMKPAMREVLLSRLVHPVLKNAKWGALAGAGALAYNSLKGDENEYRGA